MKYCQNCNAENGDAMSFCGYCGARFIENPSQVWNPGKAPTASFNETETFERNNAATAKKSNKTLFFILGGVALLVAFGGTILGVVAFYLLSANRPTVFKNTPANVSVKPEDAPTPEVSFTPPVEPTAKGSFTINANQGWQLSDINTVSQQTFQTAVQGKIDLDGIRKGVSPNGVTDEKTKSRRLYPEFPTGALLMRTRYADGKYSNIAAVTASNATGIWQNYPGERGKIEFCVNDNTPEKNSGQFTVTVTSLGVPKGE